MIRFMDAIKQDGIVVGYNCKDNEKFKTISLDEAKDLVKDGNVENATISNDTNDIKVSNVKGEKFICYKDLNGDYYTIGVYSKKIKQVPMTKMKSLAKKGNCFGARFDVPVCVGTRLNGKSIYDKAKEKISVGVKLSEDYLLYFVNPFFDTLDKTSKEDSFLSNNPWAKPFFMEHCSFGRCQVYLFNIKNDKVVGMSPILKLNDYQGCSDIDLSSIKKSYNSKIEFKYIIETIDIYTYRTSCSSMYYTIWLDNGDICFENKFYESGYGYTEEDNGTFSKKLLSSLKKDKKWFFVNDSGKLFIA